MPSPSLVLIADDTEDVRGRIQEILDNEGYRLEFATSGAQALAMAKRLAPDLILLADHLSDAAGIDVVKALREEATVCDIPVLLVMSRDDRDSRLRAWRSGADDLLFRPLDRAEVRARVRGIARLNRFRHLQEAARYKADLETAAAVQRFLLPAAPPVVPGLEICASAQYCDQLGGDTYDFLKLPNGRLMITIGDVAGHGVGPALLMAATQALVRREALEIGEHPEKVLQRLNHYLADTLDGVRFLTMTIAVWDAATRTLEWSSAGHEPMLRVDAARHECYAYTATSIPLGVDRHATFVRGEPLSLAPGDIVFLCTDGLPESTNPAGIMFGRQRLAAELLARASNAACDICRDIRSEVERFRSGQPKVDDVTLCLLKVVNPADKDTSP